MDKEYFTLDNTEGYTKEELQEHNEKFEEFAAKQGFNLTDDQELKSASEKYFNGIMI